MSTEGREQRRHPRISVRSEVEIVSAGEADKCIAINVSPGGCSVQCLRRLAVESKVDLAFHLAIEGQVEKSRVLLRFDGRVAWVDQRDDDDSGAEQAFDTNAGIEFIDPEPKKIALLMKFFGKGNT